MVVTDFQLRTRCLAHPLGRMLSGEQLLDQSMGLGAEQEVVTLGSLAEELNHLLGSELPAVAELGDQEVAPEVLRTYGQPKSGPRGIGCAGRIVVAEGKFGEAVCRLRDEIWDDAFQVHASDPRVGAWRMTSEELSPDQMHPASEEFSFVSGRLRRSAAPYQLTEAIPIDCHLWSQVEPAGAVAAEVVPALGVGA